MYSKSYSKDLLYIEFPQKKLRFLSNSPISVPERDPESHIAAENDREGDSNVENYRFCPVASW